jgi:hypothetical protein
MLLGALELLYHVELHLFECFKEAALLVQKQLLHLFFHNLVDAFWLISVEVIYFFSVLLLIVVFFFNHRVLVKSFVREFSKKLLGKLSVDLLYVAFTEFQEVDGLRVNFCIRIFGLQQDLVELLCYDDFSFLMH